VVRVWYLKIKGGTFECFVLGCREKARTFVALNDHWEGWRATTTRSCVRENQRFLGASWFIGEAVCEEKPKVFGCFAVLWGKNEEPLVALNCRWKRWRTTTTRKTWWGTLNRRRSCDLDIEEKQRRVSETKPRRNTLFYVAVATWFRFGKFLGFELWLQFTVKCCWN